MWARCIMLNLRSKTSQGTSLLLLTQMLTTVALELWSTSRFYDKRDDFNFHITNFPFLSSNIPSSPASGVFISQLLRYARACSSYECKASFRQATKTGKPRKTLEIVIQGVLWSMRYGILFRNIKSLSWMLNDNLTPDQLRCLPKWSDFSLTSRSYYRAWPLQHYE